jgi:hypothetical protein
VPSPGTVTVHAVSQAVTSAVGSAPVTIAGPAPDFTLTMSAGPGSVAAGGSAAYTVTTTGNNGFNGVVSFGTSGLPAGVTGSFNPSTVTGSGSTALTVKTTTGASSGTFAITVTGASGALQHTATASLNVTGGSSPPAAVSVTPNSGSGTSRTFTFKFSDPNGAANIVTAQIDINSHLASMGACYLYYSRGANSIYLASDAGNWKGPLTIGHPGTLQNSQCAVNAGASSASMSGTTLTLNLSFSFQSAFAGTKNIYMKARTATLDSGWAQRGTWIVP